MGVWRAALRLEFSGLFEDEYEKEDEDDGKALSGFVGRDVLMGGAWGLNGAVSRDSWGLGCFRRFFEDEDEKEDEDDGEGVPACDGLRTSH